MRRRVIRERVLSAGFVLLSASATASAVEPALLVAPAAGASAEVGFASSVDGTLVALGAPGYVGMRGAVFTYDCTDVPCAAPQQVTAPAPSAGARFGYAVSVSGNTLAVGAPQEGAGRVYIYVRNAGSWTLQAQLAAFDGVAGDRFGGAVAVDGDRLVVGAERDDARRGAAYFFQRNAGAWTQVTRVTGNGSVANDRFGTSVAIDGTRAAVGAPWHDPSATAAGYARGAVYTYTLSGGTVTPDTKIVPSDSDNAAQFGYSVALDGTRLAAGAPGVDGVRGALYVFERGASWAQTARLAWTGNGYGAQFGRAIALSGARLIAGAPYAGNNVAACGLAQLYAFGLNGWQPDPSALPVIPASQERGGWSVAIAGNRWLLAAPGLDGGGRDAGGAYWFDAADGLFGDGYEEAASVCGAVGS